MRNVFILGAGFMQKPAIMTAKELGCRVTVADGNKDAYCVPLCDEFTLIDLKDTSALCEYALHLKKTTGIDAVFTAGTDFSAAVAKIAEVCGLFSHSYEASLNASDKIRMRKCFSSHGVNSPKFFEVSEADNGTETLEGLLHTNGFESNNFPLVVKPVDNMGARGCRMARNFDELVSAVKTAISYSRSKRAIIEEYMDGPEFSIDSLVFNGTINITGFADRHIYYPPYFIEMGHTMPTKFSINEKNLLIDEFKKGVFALGLHCGAAKGDVKLTKDGPKIGEIAARLSGGYMSGWTYPYASGVNLTKLALQIALGDDPYIPLTGISLESHQVSAERAWISIPGKIASIQGFDEAKNSAQVKDIFPRAKEGDFVSFPVNNVEKCGNIISCAQTREEAVKSAELAVKTIVLRLTPEQKSTKDFLEEDVFTEFPPSAYQISKKQYDELISGEKGATVSIKDLKQSFLQHLVIKKPFFRDDERMLDWNHRSAYFSLTQFFSIAEKEEKLSKSVCLQRFWHYFIRGGLQGILYMLDEEQR